MKEAFVTIRYDDEGSPVADPAELRVKPGTRITWRNDAAQDRCFALDFDDRVPESGPPRRHVDSHREHGRFQASIIATPPPPASATTGTASDPSSQRFAYNVRAGDRSGDPAIIIEK